MFSSLFNMIFIILSNCNHFMLDVDTLLGGDLK